MIRRHPPLLPVPKRRIATEPVVPMINVVFLLLIFFLMTAQITTPPPFDLVLPTAQAQEDGTKATLHVSSSGELAFEHLRGTAALDAASAQSPLTLQADARLAAGRLARILADLATRGATDIRLVTEGAR